MQDAIQTRMQWNRPFLTIFHISEVLCVATEWARTMHIIYLHGGKLIESQQGTDDEEDDSQCQEAKYQREDDCQDGCSVVVVDGDRPVDGIYVVEKLASPSYE